jgi:hypothetical protein
VSSQGTLACRLTSTLPPRLPFAPPVAERSGEGVIALNESANRDEEVWEDPDRFDIRWVVITSGLLASSIQHKAAVQS